MIGRYIMRRFVTAILLLVSFQFVYGGTYLFSTTTGTLTELNLPWVKQGDTLLTKITIRNTDAVSHSVLLSLSDKSGVFGKNGSPLFFWQFGLVDSIRVVLNADESREFTLYDIPSKYPAGRFRRFINIYQDYATASVATLPITVHSALTLHVRNRKDEELADLLELSPNVPEYFPIYFHNDSTEAQVLTEFLSTVLPSWIGVQNKYSYPLVVLPGEIINFGNIVITPLEPNLEKLEGPVYLVYKTGAATRRTGISLYITSAVDSALLKPCVEFFLDSTFGPVKIGASATQDLRIKSNRAYPIRLSQPKLDWGDTEGFSVQTTVFPLDIPAFGERTVPVTFSPQTISPLVKYRYAAGFTAHAESDSSSCDPSITLAGVVFIEGAVARGAQRGVELTITPNPMPGYGVISAIGMNDPIITITDILGHRKTMAVSDELSVAGLPNGCYVVRVSGMDGVGHTVVLSRLLEIRR